MISVIIPTYNRAKVLKKSIDSVLNQTFADIELIVVDDASTDDTDRLIKNINDKRVRYIKLDKNLGACNARNVGVKHSIGEYVAFQDSDDIWYPEKLEKQYEYIKKNDLDFVFCGMSRIKLEDPSKQYFYPNVDLDDSKSYFTQLLYLNRVGTQTILCKKECFEQIKFDINLKRFQDWDFALQAAKIFKMGYLRECLVDSYIQLDSISKSKKANKKAWKSLYDKYYLDIEKDISIHAKYLFRLGNEVAVFDSRQANMYYKKSLAMQKSKITFIFYILSCFRMKKISEVLLNYQRNRLFK